MQDIPQLKSYRQFHPSPDLVSSIAAILLQEKSFDPLLAMEKILRRAFINGRLHAWLVGSSKELYSGLDTRGYDPRCHNSLTHIKSLHRRRKRFAFLARHFHNKTATVQTTWKSSSKLIKHATSLSQIINETWSLIHDGLVVLIGPEGRIQ